MTKPSQKPSKTPGQNSGQNPNQDPALKGLVALSSQAGVDIRPTLLRVMTDLYLQKPVHTDDEEAEYTRMALKLIDHVDGKTRSMIAGKIAGYPNAPAAVRQRLLKDHIVCKAPEEAARESAKEGPGKSAIEEVDQRLADDAARPSAKTAAAATPPKAMPPLSN